VLPPDQLKFPVQIRSHLSMLACVPAARWKEKRVHRSVFDAPRSTLETQLGKLTRRNRGEEFMAARRQKSFDSKSLIVLALMSVVGATLPAATVRAEDCLAAPNSPAREGTRWYYRLDRATQHKCWYMHAPDQTAQQGAVPAPPAPRFAIPVPRPRPSAANAASSLSPGDTDSFSSRPDAIAAKPSATAPG
jgi:hypothetical protein